MDLPEVLHGDREWASPLAVAVCSVVEAHTFWLLEAVHLLGKHRTARELPFVPEGRMELQWSGMLPEQMGVPATFTLKKEKKQSITAANSQQRVLQHASGVG